MDEFFYHHFISKYEDESDKDTDDLMAMAVFNHDNNDKKLRKFKGSAQGCAPALNLT
jgi:hypothetical protein